MAYVNIFNKITDLEKKLDSLSENSSNNISNNISDDNLKIIPEDLINRIKNLEILNDSSIVEDLLSRITNLEKKYDNELIKRIEIVEDIQRQSDLSDRIFAIENNQMLQNNSAINNLTERVNKLESDYMITHDLSQKVLNIENDKYISQLPQLFEHVNVIDCKYIPPDLTERINSLELKLGFQ